MRRATSPDQGPLVSVIVPVLNAEPTLRACVEALLAQDYPAERREIIFVDNGSTDRSAELLAKYPVRVVTERRLRGPGSARNQGIRASAGEVLAFTDADCIASEGWLRAIVEPHADPGVGACAGKVLPAPPRTLVERYCAESGIMSQEFAIQHPYLPAAQTCNASYRRIALEQVGLFDVGLRTGEDTDLAWRLQLESGFRIAYEPSAVVYHRHRASSRELFRAYYGYGLGDELLRRLYPEAPYPPLRSAIGHLALGAGLAATALPRRAMKLLLRRMSPLEFWWPYLDLLTQAGRVLGRCRAMGAGRARPVRSGPARSRREPSRLGDPAP